MIIRMIIAGTIIITWSAAVVASYSSNGSHGGAATALAQAGGISNSVTTSASAINAPQHQDQVTRLLRAVAEAPNPARAAAFVSTLRRPAIANQTTEEGYTILSADDLFNSINTGTEHGTSGIVSVPSRTLGKLQFFASLSAAAYCMAWNVRAWTCGYPRCSNPDLAAFNQTTDDDVLAATEVMQYVHTRRTGAVGYVAVNERIHASYVKTVPATFSGARGTVDGDAQAVYLNNSTAVVVAFRVGRSCDARLQTMINPSPL